MSRLRAVLDRLNDIEATIAKAERLYSGQSPTAFQLSMRSLESRRNLLREELSDASREAAVDICDYRIIPDGSGSYAISAVTSALHDFQDLVTLVFDAITSKPKQRARLDPDVVAKTQFDFGFSYSGSLGVVLTVPNERLLAIDSDLDRAVSAVFSLMKVQSADAIKEVAANYGVPTIRKLYSWSKIHRDFGLSSEIKWVRENVTKRSVLAQPQELDAVCKIIESKSEKQIDTIKLTGTLVGINVTRRTFMLEFPHADSITGTLAKEFDTTKLITVNHRYTASLQKQTVIQYASDKDEISWILNEIAELN